jgi:hypothetical protein
MKKLSYVFYLVLVAVLLSSCHNLLHEKELIIEAKKLGNKEYKYKYYIKAYPTYQVFYSNQEYDVGDTLKYCH